jgi:hypothetical protein
LRREVARSRSVKAVAASSRLTYVPRAAAARARLALARPVVAAHQRPTLPFFIHRKGAAAGTYGVHNMRVWGRTKGMRSPRRGTHRRVSWTHRRSLHHSSESSSQLRGALSAWLWKREEVERRRLHGRRTRTVATSPCRGSRSDASPRRESGRNRAGVRTSLRAHFTSRT